MSQNRSFPDEGYAVFSEVVGLDFCQILANVLPNVESAGSRKMLEIPEVRQLAAALRCQNDLRFLLKDTVAVQCIYFKKDSAKNWSLKNHRDRVFPIAGTGPWPPAGRKEGQFFQRPPRALVDEFKAVRVHIDGAAEGDLNVIPGSHSANRDALKVEAVSVPVPQGGVLVMCPSLIHGSSRLIESTSRRVLHFVFAPRRLPHGYEWYHAI